MKLCFIDLETTGLDSKNCAIHQLSGSIIIDGDIKELFDFKIKPFEGAIIVEEALKASNVTLDMINSYENSINVYTKFISMLSKYVNKFDKYDKMFIVGYNVQALDTGSIREWFSRHNDKYYGSWFWANSMDVMLLATPYLAEVGHKMINFQQGTVAKQLGIEVDDTKLHDGAYDINICRKIYDIVCGKY